LYPKKSGSKWENVDVEQCWAWAAKIVVKKKKPSLLTQLVFEADVKGRIGYQNKQLKRPNPNMIKKNCRKEWPNYLAA
jgi:hypothetical protein